MVSVVIPSIRPDNLPICLDKFRHSQRDGDYELITITDKRDGPVEAICRGIAQAKGDYIFFINDQCSLSKGGLKKMVEFSKKHNDRIIVGHRNTPITPMSYYGIEFEPYPLIHKDLIKELDGYYAPVFKHFYADPDLAMRARWACIRIMKCPGVSVHRTCDGSMDYTGHSQAVDKWYQQDKETFIKKWEFLGKEFKEISPGRRSWLWCRLLELLPY